MTESYMQIKFDRLKQFFKIRVLQAEGSAHCIALGVALGLFVAWTPAIGFHTVAVLILALLLRANKIVALAFIWVSNPFTFFPIYYPNYLLGRMVLKHFRSAADMEVSHFHVRQFFEQFKSSSGVFHLAFWRNLLTLLDVKYAELWLGSLIAGVLVAFAGYFATYYLVSLHRERHHKRQREG